MVAGVAGACATPPRACGPEEYDLSEGPWGGQGRAAGGRIGWCREERSRREQPQGQPDQAPRLGGIEPPAILD